MALCTINIISTISFLSGKLVSELKDFQHIEVLTHWGWVMHICVNSLSNNGSGNGLSPGQRRAIIWTSAGILLIGPLGTNFSGILIRIKICSFKEMHFKMSSAKWRPFYLSLNVLTKWLPCCRQHSKCVYLEGKLQMFVLIKRCLFLRIQWTISQPCGQVMTLHWADFTWTIVDHVLWCYMVSLCLSEYGFIIGLSELKWSTRKIQYFQISFPNTMFVPWIKHDYSYKIYQHINPHSWKTSICKFLFSLWSWVS